MSCAASANELLAARDGRHQLLLAALREGFPIIIGLALNIPGETKVRAGVFGLFHRTRQELPSLLGSLRDLAAGCDRLGPYGLFGSALAPTAAKTLCVGLETARPAGRLLDLDVYDDDARPVNRADLGLLPRPCLLCGHPAVQCRRFERHTTAALLEKVDALLLPYRD